MTIKLTKFPHIDQLRHVVESVRATAKYHGITELPKIPFKGTVKLHGTNAGIVKNLKAGNIWAQSRETVLTETADNAGFAKFILNVELPDLGASAQSLLFMTYQTHFAIQLGREITDGRIAIFGEWCGKGIMKGVGITRLEKMFVIFGVKYVPEAESFAWRDVKDTLPNKGQRIMGRDAEFNTWEESWDTAEPLGQMTHWVPFGETEGVWANKTFTNLLKDTGFVEQLEKARIFDIETFPTFNITIDFNNPEASIEELTRQTGRVETCCPVAFAMDGEVGVGEGIVWKNLELWNGHKPGSFVFKTKGPKHKEAAHDKITVDPEKVAGIKAFVDGVATEHRFEKMLEKLTIAGVAIKNENTPQFLKLVGDDVLREEGDILAASELDRKDVMKSVNLVARTWWLEQCKKQPMW